MNVYRRSQSRISLSKDFPQCIFQLEKNPPAHS